MSEIDWSKAPDAEYWCEGQFFKTIDGEWYCRSSDERSWHRPAYKSPDNFSWWGNAIERPSQAWSGVGLPPVGTVCEFCGDMSDGSDWHSGLRQGMIVTVIAHFNTGFADVAAFTFMHDVSLQVEQADHLCFRPFRTPEQIAAVERSKACDEIYGILLKADRPGNRSDMAEALYDAGYRKQPKGKEDD